MYVEPRTYICSYLLSWGLTISGGALAVVSVLAFFIPGLIGDQTARVLCVIAFASMVGFSVACANCTAAAAQHAIARRFHPSVFWPAIICTLGFCTTTSIGVHLGWALMTDGTASQGLPDARIVNGAAVFIALAKPAMNWIIEGRKSIDHEQRCAAEAAEEARLSASRERDRSGTAGAAQRKEGGRSVGHLGQLGRTMVGAAAISASLAGVSAAQPAIADEAGSSFSTERHSPHTWPDTEAQAVALLQAGAKQRAIARQTGLTRYRVSLLAAGRTRVAGAGG